MKNNYGMTGFQSPCAEFAQKPLSLDERYQIGRPSIFIIEATEDSRSLDIRKGDKFLVDRAITPKEGQLSLMVISNQFVVRNFFRKMPQEQNMETGDFVWGVVTTLIREFNRELR